MQIEPTDLSRLRSYMSRGEVILFTGAGFSLGAKDRAGRDLPSSGLLKKELWQLCYGEEAFDETSSLGDLYAAALAHHRSSLESFIRGRLSVDPDTLPDYYDSLFAVPWLRCYTVNIDDLESAVERRIGGDRRPISISGITPKLSQLPGSPIAGRGLEVVHLNGLTSDPIENLTFSETQYAERIGRQEPWYSRCVVDITARPVIFIGTGLNESLLWQHMELRRRRENIGRDLRPTSLLIAPNLSRPRSEILRDLRINWVKGTAEEFANEILPQLRSEITQGFAFIRERGEGHARALVPLVGDLAAEHPNLQTEYLMGEEPVWADIVQGRAVVRAHDNALLTLAEEVLEGKRKSTAVAVIGTAGTGKSTAIMSLALKLTTGGVPVLWVDKISDATPARMRAQVRNARQKIALAIDDADMYGHELSNLLADLVPQSKDFLFVFATRSNKLDAITADLRGAPLEICEHVVPPLSDEDIDGLIAVLEKNKRLGLLTGEPEIVRRKAFRDQAGRQLLVAMIQATSGENFERKAEDEYAELQGIQRYAYLLVAIATSLRYTLTKDEVLLALGGEPPEQALSALDRLEAQHMIVSTSGVREYRCRHRVVADLVFGKAREIGELGDALIGLTWALATKVGIPLDRKSRTGKFLIRLMNHEFLINTVGVPSARHIYDGLENLLASDYHYWLQRGSLELERGDIRKAENFLGAARSLGGDDFRVGTAYAYMLMRKACEAPQDLHAQEFLDTGMRDLEAIIETSGRYNEYAFHVFGSQGLSWAHRAITEKEKRRIFLGRLLDVVKHGVELHPANENLRILSLDLKKEILMTTVP